MLDHDCCTLRQAFVWDCDACGKENVLRVMERELEHVAFNKAFGKSANQALSIPRVLICQHCSMPFDQISEEDES